MDWLPGSVRRSTVLMIGICYKSYKLQYVEFTQKYMRLPVRSLRIKPLVAFGSAAKLMLGTWLEANLVFGEWIPNILRRLLDRQTCKSSLTASLYGIDVASVCSRSLFKVTRKHAKFIEDQGANRK